MILGLGFDLDQVHVVPNAADLVRDRCHVHVAASGPARPKALSIHPQPGQPLQIREKPVSHESRHPAAPDPHSHVVGQNLSTTQPGPLGIQGVAP